MFYCKACKSKVDIFKEDHYSFCLVCGTATYITTRSASDDNKEYFNSIYANKNLQIIEGREKLFEIYNRFAAILNFKETECFKKLLGNISKIIIAAEKSVEIGFGRGDELINYLHAGANIYGLDISQEAVGNFKSTYTDYSSRVICSMSYDYPVDVVYSNALFEHLDNPDKFLDNAYNMLNSGGRLIIRLPVIARAFQDKHEKNSDINFWKPCHRVLYTLKGLTILLGKHGFIMKDYASLAYYGYKVMSRMLRLGYEDIVYARNPYYKINGLDSDYVYIKILSQSLFDKIICSDFAFIAEK